MLAKKIIASNVDLSSIPLGAIANTIRMVQINSPAARKHAIEGLTGVFSAIRRISDSEKKDVITVADAMTEGSKRKVTRLTVDYQAGEIVVTSGGNTLGVHFKEKGKTTGYNDCTNVVVEWYPTIKNKGDFDIIYALLKSVIMKYAESKGLSIGFEPLRRAPGSLIPLKEGARN